jgi:hypothetical protein
LRLRAKALAHRCNQEGVTPATPAGISCVYTANGYTSRPMREATCAAMCRWSVCSSRLAISYEPIGQPAAPARLCMTRPEIRFAFPIESSLAFAALRQLTLLRSALPPNSPINRLESAIPRHRTYDPLESAPPKKGARALLLTRNLTKDFCPEAPTRHARRGSLSWRAIEVTLRMERRSVVERAVRL